MLNKKIKDRIKSIAQSEYPKECCGFLIKNLDSLDEIVQVKNTHSNPYKYVEVDPREYLSVTLAGEIKAFFHSHAEREDFSEVDKESFKLNDFPYILYCIKTDSFHILNSDSTVNKYIGKNFEWGKSDCFNLVIEYYKAELNINIFNYIPNRKEGWWRTNGNLIEKYKKDNNFIEVIAPEKNDIIILELNRNQFHFGIYINDQFLHHPRGKKSKIEEYSDQMKNKTRYILRHKTQF